MRTVRTERAVQVLGRCEKPGMDRPEPDIAGGLKGKERPSQKIYQPFVGCFGSPKADSKLAIHVCVRKAEYLGIIYTPSFLAQASIYRVIHGIPTPSLAKVKVPPRMPSTS